jgi:hypothetical protein
MTLAVVAIVALNVGIVGALAFLMTHASRWGSYDRPDPFVWHKHRPEVLPGWHAAQAVTAHVEAGVEAIEDAVLGASSEGEQVQSS